MSFIVKHTNDFEIQTQSQNFPDNPRISQIHVLQQHILVLRPISIVEKGTTYNLLSLKDLTSI